MRKHLQFKRVDSDKIGGDHDVYIDGNKIAIWHRSRRNKSKFGWSRDIYQKSNEDTEALLDRILRYYRNDPMLVEHEVVIPPRNKKQKEVLSHLYGEELLPYL